MTRRPSVGAAADEERLEYELKARLEGEADAFRARLAAGEWRRTFRGEMLDRRYDTPDRRLEARDQVLRLRRWRSADAAAAVGAGATGGRSDERSAGGKPGGAGEAGGPDEPIAGERAVLGWKGPARGGEFRVREELETPVADRATAEALLARLGYSVVTLAIDRRVDIFQKEGVVVRIEEYPRMDVLVEIEGPPAAVEERIPELGLRREAWRPWGLPRFVSAFERRTGERARLAVKAP